ncbi:hypothetical protein HYX06_03315 [Candidatus Woesearchaeota archaeon]|nr:hypothetical protein [Candidatus Woesearchaeota archaeon]
MLMDMANPIIRYDRLYSRNEAIILFHGSPEGAASLDTILRRLSGSKEGLEFLREGIGMPNVSCEEIGSSTFTNGVPIPQQTIKMYAVDLARVPTDESYWRAYRKFTYRLVELVNARMGNPDVYNGLPVLIEQNSAEMAALVRKLRERLKQMFQGNHYLRQQEVEIYLNGLINLVAGVEPPKFVLEVTKE